jgi:hypothetical protein
MGEGNCTGHERCIPIPGSQRGGKWETVWRIGSDRRVPPLLHGKLKWYAPQRVQVALIVCFEARVYPLIAFIPGDHMLIIIAADIFEILLCEIGQLLEFIPFSPVFVGTHLS